MPNFKIDLGAVRGPKGPQGDVGPQGLKGRKGKKGRTVHIVGSVLSEDDLPEFSSVESNTGYIFDNGDGRYDLYLKGSGTTWTIHEDWQGPKGLTGDQGEVGPQGAQGDQGEQGEQGDKGSMCEPTFSIGEDGRLYVEYEKESSGHYGSIDVDSVSIDSNNVVTFTVNDPDGFAYTTDEFNQKNEGKITANGVNIQVSDISQGSESLDPIIVKLDVNSITPDESNKVTIVVDQDTEVGMNPSTNNPTYLNRTVFDVEVVSEESGFVSPITLSISGSTNASNYQVSWKSYNWSFNGVTESSSVLESSIGEDFVRFFETHKPNETSVNISGTNRIKVMGSYTNFTSVAFNENNNIQLQDVNSVANIEINTKSVTPWINLLGGISGRDLTNVQIELTFTF